MPANSPRNDDPQTSFLNAVREGQAALLEAVDRAFDLAEQTLAAQRELARTLVGVADRQLDTIVETVESSTRETLQQTEELLETDVAPTPRPEPPAAGPEADATKPQEQTPTARKQQGRQASKADRRPFEERSVEELRERARELDIEGRSNMSKDELVAALRQQSR
jgi:Rho termination factor, N-terminal domain